MEEIASFTREYSQIGGLQQAATVRYSLWADGDAFLLRAEKKGRHAQKSGSLRLTSVGQEQAGQLLQFLHENAVPVENWQEIVEELLSGQSRGEEA